MICPHWVHRVPNEDPPFIPTPSRSCYGVGLTGGVDKKLDLSAAGSGVPLEWKAASEFGVGHATATHNATSGQSGRIR